MQGREGDSKVINLLNIRILLSNLKKSTPSLWKYNL